LESTVETTAPLPSLDEIEARAAHIANLQALATRLSKKRDEAVKNKRWIEAKWLNSLRQEWGMGLLETKQEGATAGGERTPRPHLSRARADRWESRLCDMLFPANDVPWDIDAPCDDIPEQDENGQPIDVAAIKAAALASAAKMKGTIEGQLKSCHFARSGRRMCRDAVRIGSGLLMGPANAVRTKRKFIRKQGVDENGQPISQMALDVKEETAPEIREGDPWCFFPDNVENVEKCEYAFYVHIMGPLEVRALAPGFDQGEIARLLRKDPELGELAANIITRNQYLEQTESTKDKYAVWRYTGALDAKDLEVLGLGETQDDGTVKAPPVAMVDLWFCQDCILRARLSPIQADYRVPYFVFSPFPRDGSMFGLSVHELCQDSQQVAESAWLIALHNASVSAGPQFVFREGKIVPMDGKYVIRGPKAWKLKDDSVEMEEAMKVFTVPNIVSEALNIFDRATKIMDDELNTDQWASNENTQEVNTASGMAMLLNVRSILQVRVATTADSEVFQPIIERMYWWNMLNNPDESIKGEYQVVPLVQSVRLVKDVQAQNLRWFSMIGSDPRYGRYIDDYAVLQATAQMTDFPTGRFIKPKEQADKEAASSGPTPEQVQVQLVAAKAETAKAQAMLFEAQAGSLSLKGQLDSVLGTLEAQAKRIDIMQAEQDRIYKVADRQVSHEETMRDLDVREAEAGTRVQVANEREATQRMRIAADVHGNEQRTHADLVKEGMRVETTARELHVKQQTGSGI
jgi:hypothetical protein